MTRMFPIILNATYGGFKFSKQAIEEYNSRKVMNDEEKRDHVLLKYDEAKRDHVLRFDPLMAQIVQEIGERANTTVSKLVVHEIEERYRDYVHIVENEGLEDFE